MASGLIDIMKRAAMDAIDAKQMCDLRYGTVVNVSPLKVQVTNLFTIPESLLIVPERLTDHKVQVTVNWETESDEAIRGKKTMTVHNALRVGDKVALLRKQGGQSYFILDRI